MIQMLITILLALALDRFVPDRGGFQILNWYRDWAESIELRFNGGTRAQGIAAVLLALAPIILAIIVIRYALVRIAPVLGSLFDMVVLYLCLDLFRLGQTAAAISEQLDHGDVVAANRHLGDLSGKITSETTESGIAHAAVETVLKQGNTLLIAPLFWFIMLGPGGAAAQRLVAILDRIWGHRNPRFAEFGWAAARLNDLLGWVPARLTAVSYAFMGSFEDALHCWRRQGGMWSDINSGPLLASGLGAMHMHHCEETDAPPGVPSGGWSVVADAADIRRVIALVWRVLLFWFAVALLIAAGRIFGIWVR
ncbi:MAG: cobalamin biosynthesis protein CobD/CbiB [Acidiferrobacteraceae bacterium]